MSTPASGSGPSGSVPSGRVSARAFRSRTDLSQLRRQAKELLKGFRAGDAVAVGQVHAHYRDADAATFALSDAQLVLARAHGLSSWPQLVARAGGAPSAGGPDRPSTRMKPPPHMLGRRWRRESVVVDGRQAWALFCACADGDEAGVRALVAANPDLLHAQIWYGKPHDTAIRQNHVEVVRFLLDSDARGWLWNHVYVDRHNTPRRDVRHRGWEEMDKVLMDYHMGWQLQRAPRFSPAFAGLAGRIDAGDLDQTRRALRNPELQHATDLAGSGPLHLAARAGAIEIAQLLIERGFDVDAVNADGETPLDVTADTRVAQLLTDQGARRSLTGAVQVGDTARVAALLADDPDAPRRLHAGERSLLGLAAEAGHADVVRLLLDAGADPNTAERGAPFGAALALAAVQDRADLVELLLAAGVNPNASIDSMGPPVERGGPEVRQLLIDAGAQPQYPWGLDASGTRGPGWAEEQLTTALRDGHPVIRDDEERFQLGAGWGSFVHCVCEAGDVDILDRYVAAVGTQRLHELTSRHCRHDDPAFIARLVHHGVDPDNRDWMGKTALHYAAEENEVGAASAWLEQGASVDAVDVREGTTALGYAARAGHVEMVRVLLERGAAPVPAVPDWAQPQALAELEGQDAVAALLS